MSETFEPLIVGFTCNWCSYRAADLAGISRKKYAPNVRLIRLMCSGRLDPTFVLKAFAGGADGVLVSGCHPGECHYLEQNYKMLRRYTLLKRMLAQMGIEPERLRLVWASAAEGNKFADEVTAMTEEIRVLGPLNWNGIDHARQRSEKLRSAERPPSAPEKTEKKAKPAAVAARPAGPPAGKKPAAPPGGLKPPGPGKPKPPPPPGAAEVKSVPAQPATPGEVES